MSLEKLQQAIKEEAAAAEKAVVDSWQEKINQATSTITQKAKGLEEELVTTAREEGQRQARQIHQNNQLNAKAQILAAKQDELKNLQEQVVANILAWPEAESKNLLKNLLEKLPKDAAGTITAGSHHQDQLKSLVKGADLKLNEKTIKDDGGFVWHSSKQEMDLTLKNLVAGIVEQNKAKLATTLFSS